MITTLESVKAVLCIDGTDKDAQIIALIPLVEADYLAIRRKAFDVDDEGAIVYPNGSELTAIKMIEYHILGKPINGVAGTVSSESLSRYSVSYTTLTGSYPTPILNSIEKFVGFV